MKGQRQALLRSVDLQPTVDKVQEGEVLDFAQYSLLRDSADAKLYQLMGKVRSHGGLQSSVMQQGETDLFALQAACLRVSHLLQTSCLALPPTASAWSAIPATFPPAHGPSSER